MGNFQKSSENKVDIGKVLLNWNFLEFEEHKRNLSWYIGAFLVGGFLFIYSIITDNLIFAIIIILSSIILINSLRRGPRKIDFAITDKGIVLSDDFYKYDNLNKFWIIYKSAQIKKIYFEVKNIFHTQLAVPMDNISPLKLRDLLNEYLEEDIEKEDESFTEALGRILKI